jgi:tetratricopeptide (TPR) repeat protein
MHLKYIHFFFLIIIYFSQSVHSQTNPKEINFGDNYFAQKEYTKAKPIYYNLIKDKSKNAKNALLKLAFIYEKENDFTRALYFLNLYFEQNPTEKVLIKMNTIALNNNLSGYELNDFYIILLLIKQYSYIINLILALIGIYVVVVFIIKKRKNEPILTKHKFVLLLYLLGALLVLNISFFYKQGIIHNESTAIRVDPSAAAPVSEFLPAGQRINIIGGEDVWLRIFRNNNFYYINKANVWMVN